MSKESMDTEKARSDVKLSAEEIAALCAEVADERKASNVVQLKMADLTFVADYFVLCTGTSEPHLRAIAERIQRELRTRFGVRPSRVDGASGSHWTIIDYGAVMVHIMTEETRNLYQIESLWGDAPRVSDIKRIAEEAMKRAQAGKSSKES